MVVALWLLFVLVLLALGRRSEAHELATFIPDCIVLFRRLLADRRVPRRAKLGLVLLIGYLAMPFDLVPDFIPIAGQLDDAIRVALTIAYVVLTTGPDLIEELWPGSDRGLRTLLMLVSGRNAPREPT